jgi:photosystem II stability/assembly factor-like uncharacterized protein
MPMSTCTASRRAPLVALLALVALGAAAQGSPWVEVNIPEEGVGRYEALHFITADEGWVLSLRDSGRQRVRLDTFDGGETWEAQSIGEDEYRVLHRARFSDPLNGWAHADLSGYLWDERVDGHNPGEDNGIRAPVAYHRTTDGGRSWRQAQGQIIEVVYFGDVDKAREADRRYLSATQFADTRFGVIAAILGAARETTNGDEYVVYRGHSILTTHDGGETWSMHVFGDARPNDRVDPTWGPTTPVESIAIVDDQYVRIPANGGEALHFFRSDDAGRTWKAIAGNPRNGAAPTFGTRVSFATPSYGWSWNRIRAATFTTDGGSTWSVAAGFTGWGALFQAENVGWIAGFPEWDGSADWRTWPQGIFATYDGHSWTIEHSSHPVDVRELIDDQATRAIWALGSRTLLRRGHSLAPVSSSGKLPWVWGAMKAGWGPDYIGP